MANALMRAVEEEVQLLLFETCWALMGPSNPHHHVCVEGLIREGLFDVILLLLRERVGQPVSDVDLLAIKMFRRMLATIGELSARRLSRQRPGMPLVAFTPELSVERQLQLVHGLRVHQLRRRRSTDELIAAGLEAASGRGLVPRGALVVVVAGGNPLLGASNMMKLSRVP